MWESGAEVERVRFLPAAWFPRPLLDQIEPALRQVVSLVELIDSPSVGSLAEEAADSIRAASYELARHSGRPGEACMLTKQAVFDVSDLLTRASALLSGAGMHAAALAVTAVDERVVEQIVETQPIAPA
ncbi:MAG: hypothetical protein ACLPYW_03680 [Acidimicrobiales bacterium]